MVQLGDASPVGKPWRRAVQIWGLGQVSKHAPTSMPATKRARMFTARHSAIIRQAKARRTQPCYNGIYRESARIRTADLKFVRLRSPSWMATARNSPLGARPALIRIRRTAAAIGRCIPDNFSALIGAVRKMEGIRIFAVVLSRRESRTQLDR